MDGARTGLGSIGVIRACQSGFIATGMFVERSGLTLVPAMLLVPVLLTYIPLAAIHVVNPGQAKRKILLWCPAVALLVFCGW